MSYGSHFRDRALIVPRKPARGNSWEDRPYGPRYRAVWVCGATGEAVAVAAAEAPAVLVAVAVQAGAVGVASSLAPPAPAGVWLVVGVPVGVLVDGTPVGVLVGGTVLAG
jgi:hypothetical protein